MTKSNKEDYWGKLSFILDGDDDDGDSEDGYRDRLYQILEDILCRLKRVEEKSHLHKFQLPEYKDRLESLKPNQKSS
jgi:hypothetical protein